MKALIRLVVIIVAVSVIVSVMVDVDGEGNGTSTAQQESPRATASTADEGSSSSSTSLVHEDDGKQGDREELIQELMTRGLIEKATYDGGSLPKVYITDDFRLLDRKQQNQFLEVIYAYYQIEDDDFGVGDDGLYRSSLVLKEDDGTTNGRRVGEYDPIDGVSW